MHRFTQTVNSAQRARGLCVAFPTVVCVARTLSDAAAWKCEVLKCFLIDTKLFLTRHQLDPKLGTPTAANPAAFVQI